ncbi:MAG TPA: hypothetical protein VG099_21190 [Gemmataceae bacterium]|jgi:hypothetical protein|nr:hypothetical protein [Gemmataceae bacterium]
MLHDRRRVLEGDRGILLAGQLDPRELMATARICSVPAPYCKLMSRTPGNRASGANAWRGIDPVPVMAVMQVSLPAMPMHW